MALQRPHIKTKPLKWTKEEEMLLYEQLKKDEISLERIKDLFPYRSLVSIKAKIRKMRIEKDIFGKSYRQQKAEFTDAICKKVNPSVVFEAYAGTGHQTFEWIKFSNVVYASELSKQKYDLFINNIIQQNFFPCESVFTGWRSFTKGDRKIHTFQGDAIKAAAFLCVNDIKIDLVDLDTCGSTVLTIPIYLSLLKPKYLVITHGEFHSYRFRREDVLRRILCHREICSSPFPIENLNKELDRAVKTVALRSHNEVKDSFFPLLIDEIWLGEKNQGMLRRVYKIQRPKASADSLNELSQIISIS